MRSIPLGKCVHIWHFFSWTRIFVPPLSRSYNWYVRLFLLRDATDAVSTQASSRGLGSDTELTVTLARFSYAHCPVMSTSALYRDGLAMSTYLIFFQLLKLSFNWSIKSITHLYITCLPTMAAKFPVPSKDQFLAIACTNVGVGPGGTTSMLA